MNPVILHIPHASVHIPPEERDLFVTDDAHLVQQNILWPDLHTDALYQCGDAARLVFPISRLVVDPERFSDDALEPMAKKGMGALYRVDTNMNEMRPVIPDHRRKKLMDSWYWPHHNALDDMAQERLEKFGLCLIFDCHSYPSKALPYEDATQFRPEIGIGTDSYHTPTLLRDAMAKAFRERGYEVGVDTPFAGALVPNRFYGRDKRVHSIMIEVRRDLYMDETTGAKNAEFDKIRADLTKIMIEASALSL